MNRSTDTVHSMIQHSAMGIAEDVAGSLETLADHLQKIAPNRYGLLITSLRWHAAQTASNDFLAEYCIYVSANLNYEYA